MRPFDALEDGPGPMRPDDEAAEALTTATRQKRQRRLLRRIPSAPRCKMCHRPFGGAGGPVMRLLGLGPWPGNPSYCRGCFRDLYRRHEGAEIECSLLFADVRDSTRMAERMRPRDFRLLMDRFYRTAFSILVARDAFVDKFVGDEVIGIFVPAMSDGPHARQAIDAALDLLRATGHGGGTPWIPIGIGINSGVAYVGAVGTDEHVEFTALGDAVNVAARLASAAGGGELLATMAAIETAGAAAEGLERRSLDLKGKSSPERVAVLSLASTPWPDA